MDEKKRSLAPHPTRLAAPASGGSTKKTGWINGLIGVSIFAGSLPATRVAVADFDPTFLTSARATVAAILGLFFLLLLRQPWPKAANLLPLGITAFGVVLGFPFLTALALQYVTSAHSIVFVGLLPLCTAAFAVLRGGERPRLAFWLFAIAGAVFVAGYAALGRGEVSLKGDLLMLAAVVVCGLGYAEGARLTRTLGGWQVISWSLAIALPVMLPIALFTMPASFDHVGAPAWYGLAYVSIFSMLIGFIFWYRGLAQGGIAAVGQLQLLQPFIGLALAALLLHEKVSWMMLLATLAAAFCVLGAKKYAVR
ncbi:DMT family transporter [Ottowia thiooxydans]|uniref:DMT family transporter n=1 Tax=Ottowia thiooxydans TaxID=219182 RepID=UPI00041D5F91|nr:DMT family transporter [Ottowia thiooxydans]